MRVSTTEMYQHAIASMNLQQSIVDNLQSKISSGKRITTGADDPLSAVKASNLREQLSRIDRFIKSADTARSKLEYEDSILASVSDAYQRINELIIYAGDGSLSRSDLATIANEIDEQTDALFELVNTRNEQGDYIFSGFKSRTAAVALSVSGQALFEGDEGEKEVSLGSMSVLISDSGKKIFFDVPTDRLVGQVTPIISTGTAVASQPVVTGLSDYPPTETYSIQFEVGGTFSVYPSDHPTVPLSGFEHVPYVSGQPIEFEGIKLSISGAPNAGDIFEVSLQPLGKQDVFLALQKVITAIRDTELTSSELSYQLGQGLTDMQYAQENMLNTRTSIGARLNMVDMQTGINENLKVITQTYLSSLEDLDYAEAISQLTFNSFILQAAQQSFVKIQSLGIFNLL